MVKKLTTVERDAVLDDVRCQLVEQLDSAFAWRHGTSNGADMRRLTRGCVRRVRALDQLRAEHAEMSKYVCAYCTVMDQDQLEECEYIVDGKTCRERSE